MELMEDIWRRSIINVDQMRHDGHNVSGRGIHSFIQSFA